MGLKRPLITLCLRTEQLILLGPFSELLCLKKARNDQVMAVTFFE